jgi:hypothetical protein
VYTSKKPAGNEISCTFVLNDHQVMNLILYEMEKNPKFDLASLAGKAKLRAFCRDKLHARGIEALVSPSDKMLLRRQDVLSALKGVLPMSG